MAVTETITFDKLGVWWTDLGRTAMITDWRPALKRCELAVIADTKENFAGGHDPDGNTWPPLKRPRSSNRSKGSRGLPLRDKGLLAASLSARGAGNHEVLTESRLEWGTNLHYASFHQEGTKNIPQRRFEGWNPSLVEECDVILADFAIQQITRG